MTQKIKISITLDPKTLEYVDQRVKDQEYVNRSQCIEKILQSWSRHHLSSVLHEEIATYYRSGASQEEKEEDDDWHLIGDESVRPS
jgi:metal-responsive CopG/Arc/MetJ family transcriptional regulator